MHKAGADEIAPEQLKRVVDLSTFANNRNGLVIKTLYAYCYYVWEEKASILLVWFVKWWKSFVLKKKRNRRRFWDFAYDGNESCNHDVVRVGE